jgi:predicted glycoside hydrolase/deacetylase ChbG (UPF0249 family)
MRMRLIVNADDYGRTAAVSQGVRIAHLFGIVTSTTCMMNMPTVVDDICTALEETPHLGLGVHLVLTSGKPLLPAEQVSSLVSADGSFHKLDQLLARLDQIDPEQVQAEWRAQVEKFVAAAGRAPTHLDSHHHSSYFTEPLFRGMLELAREYGAGIRLVIAQGHDDSLAGLPAQVLTSIQEYAPRLLNELKPRTPHIFHASFYEPMATKEELLRLINTLQPGTSELMCHPGYSDPILLAGSVYARQRESELAILTNPEIRQAIHARGIQLISFAQL